MSLLTDTKLEMRPVMSRMGVMVWSAVKISPFLRRLVMVLRYTLPLSTVAHRSL